MEDWYLDLTAKTGSIVMEYCITGSVDRLIKRHKEAGMRLIDEHFVWKWGTQIADALLYCHYGMEPYDEKKREEWNTIFHRGACIHIHYLSNFLFQ